MARLAPGERLPVFEISRLPACLFDSRAAGNNAPAVMAQVVFVSAFLPAENSLCELFILFSWGRRGHGWWGGQW